MLPSFDNTVNDTKCYMYDSLLPEQDYLNDTVSTHIPSLVFQHNGHTITKSQTVHLQFYEPEKNANRIVFDINPISKWDINYVDSWIDSECSAAFNSSSINQVLTVYPESDIDVQFKTIYTQRIDPNSLWNLVGVFPKYIQQSKLSITHTQEMARATYVEDYYVSGKVRVSPADFKKTTITEKRDVTIVSSLGVIGGFVSILFAARVLLFGARPTEPWGVFQRLSFRSSWEESKRKNLKKYFRIPDIDSVPFVTPVHQRFSDIYALNTNNNAASSSCLVNTANDGLLGHHSNEVHSMRSTGSNTNNESTSNEIILNMQERLTQLEGRNQVLELVLKAYYIDDRIFHEIHASSTPNKNSSNVSLLDETVGREYQEERL